MQNVPRHLLAALVLATGLAAQSDEQFLRGAFARLDADADGTLVRKEFPGSDRQFESMDTERDGKVTFPEYRESPVGKALLRGRAQNQEEARPRTSAAALAPERWRFLLRIDANKDGKITRAEWNGADDAFLQLDLDDNGVLDARDRAEAEAQAPPPPAPLPEAKGALTMPEDLLRRFDKDKDGRLQGKELAAEPWLQAGLPWADLDGDRGLDERELGRLVGAIAAVRAAAEQARARPVPYDVPFDAWDKDKDERVRQNEWQGPLPLFVAIDLDRDSAVSREEVLRFKKRVVGDDFLARFDLDGDGKVTAAEFAGPPGAFARADKSGDGAVNRGDR